MPVTMKDELVKVSPALNSTPAPPVPPLPPMPAAAPPLPPLPPVIAAELLKVPPAPNSTALPPTPPSPPMPAPPSPPAPPARRRCAVPRQRQRHQFGRDHRWCRRHGRHRPDGGVVSSTERAAKSQCREEVRAEIRVKTSGFFQDLRMHELEKGFTRTSDIEVVHPHPIGTYLARNDTIAVIKGPSAALAEEIVPYVMKGLAIQ